MCSFIIANVACVDKFDDCIGAGTTVVASPFDAVTRYSDDVPRCNLNYGVCIYCHCDFLRAHTLPVDGACWETGYQETAATSTPF